MGGKPWSRCDAVRLGSHVPERKPFHPARERVIRGTVGTERIGIHIRFRRCLRRLNRRHRYRNGHRDSIVLPGWQRRDQIGNMPVLTFNNCRLGAVAEGLVFQHAVDGAERYPCRPKILWRRREWMVCEPRFVDEAVDEDLKRPAFDHLGNVVSARRGVVPLHLANEGIRPVLDGLVDFVKLHHTHDSQHPTQRLLIDTRAQAEAHVSGPAGKRSDRNEFLVEKVSPVLANEERGTRHRT